ncbi:uncharacterized protein [Malus domestica]|uniref:uncharacterized protein isoform X2 n=1 Tax=Malus domestica TaxID=3750 RepID=UPI0010AA49B5|nr:uncharacterized protein LOC103422586 isoform X2 [Malus domestica]
MKYAIKKLDGSEFRNAFDRQSVRVGQGHEEKSTLEMVRCTNMGKARQGKAGILLWMRRPITRLSRITGGQMSLVTLANCCQLNLEKGHLASTPLLILDHHRLQLMNHQMNFLQYRAAQRILLKSKRGDARRLRRIRTSLRGLQVPYSLSYLLWFLC